MLIFSCAKKRSVKPLPPDQLRMEKSVFAEGQEWYLAETITKISAGSPSLVAHHANERIVKFKLTKKHLIMYHVDTNKHDTQVLNEETGSVVGGEILSRFPIAAHFDMVFRKDPYGKNTTIRDEKKDDVHQPWQVRSYMRVDFAKEKIESRISVAPVGGQPYQQFVQSLAEGGDILRLDISPEKYIDLVVRKQMDGVNGARDIFELRKFFIPVNKGHYLTKAVQGKWMEHLGFYTTKIQSFDQYNVPVEKLLINRWDTRKKHVTFYFSKSWASELGLKYKPLMIKAVTQWNKVFKEKLGLDHFILLKDSDGSQTLGDLRFNMIEWLVSDHVVLGSGQFLRDPRTGEIINANIMVNIGGVGSEFDRLSKPETAIRVSEAVEQYLSGVMSSEFDFKALNWGEENAKINTLLKDYHQFISKQKNIHHHESVRWKNSDLDKDLETVLLNIFSHELGHTLGLTHNFKGSMDKNNFYKDLNASGDYRYRQSSIMDYVEDVAGMLDKPGPYDYAAIEKGYSDESLHALDQIPLDKINDEKYFKEKFPYKFCGDLQTSTDPTCNRFDQGTSAKEIAQFYLTDYLEGYANRNKVYTYLKKYFPANYHSHYVLYLASKYFIPLRTFVDFWAKKRGDFTQIKEGEDLTKAAKISMEFMFAALFNNSGDKVEKTVTVYDKILALHFLNMKSITEVMDESGFFQQPINYFDFAKMVGEQDDYLKKYLTVLSGVSIRYEPYLGFYPTNEAEINYVNPLVRNMAAGLFMMSESKGGNVNRDFHIVVKDDHRKQIEILMHLENELAKHYEILKQDFLPIVLPEEMTHFDELFGERSYLSQFYDLPKYSNNLESRSKLLSELATIKDMIVSSEKRAGGDKRIEKIIHAKMTQLKKMWMFETNPGVEIELDDPKVYQEQVRTHLSKIEFSSEEKARYLKTSWKSLVDYQNVLASYQAQKKQLGLHVIDRKKLAKVHQRMNELAFLMEKNFTPVVDPINLLNSSTLNHLQRTLRLKPGYLEMYLQNTQAFNMQLEGLSLEQIEQEYMQPAEELSEGAQKIVSTCFAMLSIYEEITRKVRSFDDSLEPLIRLNEKLVVEQQQLLNGTMVGMMTSDTYEKLLLESEKQHRFSNEYYQMKRAGLKHLVELEKLENAKDRILFAGDTFRMVDFTWGRIIETPSSGVIADLALRIGRIDDLIRVLEKEDGNESRILELREYREHELDYLTLLGELHAISKD